jgi:hypothetical protein
MLRTQVANIAISPQSFFVFVYLTVAYFNRSNSDRRTVNKWRGAVVANFKVLLKHVPGRCEENYERKQSAKSTFVSIIE